MKNTENAVIQSLLLYQKLHHSSILISLRFGIPREIDCILLVSFSNHAPYELAEEYVYCFTDMAEELEHAA